MQAYQPEGIYLNQLTNPVGLLVQKWGDAQDYYTQYKYNGIHLAGYFGLGFQVEQGASVLAADMGRVMEISIDEGGLNKYIKIEHWWGESIYALLGKIHVVSGQTVERGNPIAIVGKTFLQQTDGKKTNRFHFCLRIHPYDRFDGWGGFTDPLPYINPNSIIHISNIDSEQIAAEHKKKDCSYEPLPLVEELPYMRRP